MTFISSLGGVIEEAATRLNEVSADEEAVYKNWFNACTRDLHTSFPNAPTWYASADRTLSSGTRHYTNFPSDLDHLIAVTFPAADVKLKFLTEEEFAAVQPSAAETGNPVVYTLHGASDPANTQIEFYPAIGSDTVTVNYQYRIQPPTVSTVSAAIPIYVKYGELYVRFIEMMGLRRREDYAQADAIEAKYETLKQRWIADFKRRTEEPWRIKSVREFTQANRSYGDEIVNLFWDNSF